MTNILSFLQQLTPKSIQIKELYHTTSEHFPLHTPKVDTRRSQNWYLGFYIKLCHTTDHLFSAFCFTHPLTFEYRSDSGTPVSIRLRLNLTALDVLNDFHFCYNFIYFMKYIFLILTSSTLVFKKFFNILTNKSG